MSSLPDVSFLRNLHTLEVPDPSVRKLPQSFPASLRELHLAHLTDASSMRGHAFNEARLSGPLRTLNIQASFLWLQRCTRLASLSGKVRLMWIQRSAVRLSELRNLEGLESLDLLGGYRSEHLPQLEGCTSLRRLTLAAFRGVNDADFAPLAQLPSLEYLNVHVGDAKLFKIGARLRGFVTNGLVGTRDGVVVPDAYAEYCRLKEEHDLLCARLRRVT